MDPRTIADPDSAKWCRFFGSGSAATRIASFVLIYLKTGVIFTAGRILGLKKTISLCCNHFLQAEMSHYDFNLIFFSLLSGAYMYLGPCFSSFFVSEYTSLQLLIQHMSWLLCKSNLSLSYFIWQLAICSCIAKSWCSPCRTNCICLITLMRSSAWQKF